MEVLLGALNLCRNLATWQCAPALLLEALVSDFAASQQADVADCVRGNLAAARVQVPQQSAICAMSIKRLIVLHESEKSCYHWASIGFLPIN